MSPSSVYGVFGGGTKGRAIEALLRIADVAIDDGVVFRTPSSDSELLFDVLRAA